jgi:hypothetical protein
MFPGERDRALCHTEAILSGRGIQGQFYAIPTGRVVSTMVDRSPLAGASSS